MSKPDRREIGSVIIIGSILASFWLGGCLAFFAGYFGGTLLDQPLADLAWLAAWIVVPIFLIAACAGLVHASASESHKGAKRSPRRPQS
jgi:hypothetical protein